MKNTCELSETWKQSSKSEFIKKVPSSRYKTLEYGNDIGSTWFEGSMYNDEVTLQFKNSIKDDFYTTFNSDLVAIEKAAISFFDNNSGHVGMAPRDPESPH